MAETASYRGGQRFRAGDLERHTDRPILLSERAGKPVARRHELCGCGSRNIRAFGGDPARVTIVRSSPHVQDAFNFTTDTS